MSYPKYVEDVIDEIISALKEDRMQDCHWIDLGRLRRFDFERRAIPIYGRSPNRETGKWEKVQIIPPFLSTWTVAKGFSRKPVAN